MACKQASALGWICYEPCAVGLLFRPACFSGSFSIFNSVQSSEASLVWNSLVNIAKAEIHYQNE